MLNHSTSLCLALAVCTGMSTASIQAQEVYLNESNISVALGASMAPEPFANRTTAESLANLIDAPTAASAEDHTQITHVWLSGGTLEIDFDFGIEYDLSTLHFWNYFAEGFDVDNIDFTFYDGNRDLVGTLLGVQPALGGSGGNPIFAEDIPLSFPAKVQFVNAVLSGDNSQVDFNNIGFTGVASCPPASWESFGDGWPGTNGIPDFGLDALPIVGTTVNILVGNSSDSPAPTCLIWGFQEMVTQTQFGGTLWVEMLNEMQLHAVPVSGQEVPWEIGTDTALCGIEYYGQLVQLDPGASAGISFSRAIRALIGIDPPVLPR